ncbi:MAG: hypothetical protein HY898_22485 [Deltaproteobacteria bacterium]|nr:hypothetical protein [Deltaproteobacteria bacterium]
MRYATPSILFVTAAAGLCLLPACGSDHGDLLSVAGNGGTAGSGGSNASPCETSLDCPKGLVCAASEGQCVQCETEADCGPDKACISHSCKDVIACESDNQCTPFGKLCDKVAGMCVDCLTQAQCPTGKHCEQGVCETNACTPGSSKCQDNAVASCSADGTHWGAATPCASQTTCQATEGTASCVPWLCQPDATTCQGDLLVTCASDGMSIVSTVDCTTQSMKCLGDACSSLACVPNAKFCAGADLRQCNAQGSDSLLVMTCGSGQYCDDATASCQNLLCTPGQPVCLGDVATTCNASGTGYTPGGTDCAAQGKACNAGACQGCPGGSGPPDNVRLVEVFIGNSDYIVLENHGACPAELDTLHLQIGAVDTANNLDFDLPQRVLASGERVYVVDTNGAKPGDIPVQDNIFLTPDTGEYVLLCNGPCASGVAVDYFAHASGAQPPLPPLGITFTPAPLTGITVATAEQNAYLRVAFTGSFPSFKAGDWQVATCTRPWVNPPQCPASAPSSGTACSQNNLLCIYGAVQCNCLNPLGWYCM